MTPKITIKAIRPLLIKIVRAVEKGCGEDVRSYIEQSDKATNNALKFLRSDNINTNLRDTVASETVDLKTFPRGGWTGCLLIDRLHLLTFTICAKQTLDRIPRKKDRSIPHYLQSILYAQNSQITVPDRQMFFPGLVDRVAQFSDEVLKDDYCKIMADDISFGDGYRHIVIIYERDQYQISSIAMRLLDKDFRIAQEYSLMDLLHPNFGDLTATLEATQQKDAHNLISVKASLRDGKNGNGFIPKISAKTEAEKKLGVASL